MYSNTLTLLMPKISSKLQVSVDLKSMGTLRGQDTHTHTLAMQTITLEVFKGINIAT